MRSRQQKKSQHQCLGQWKIWHVIKGRQSKHVCLDNSMAVTKYVTLPLPTPTAEKSVVWQSCQFLWIDVWQFPSPAGRWCPFSFMVRNQLEPPEAKASPKPESRIRRNALAKVQKRLPSLYLQPKTNKIILRRIKRRIAVGTTSFLYGYRNVLSKPA